MLVLLHSDGYDHRPGKRQASHAHILQTGLRLAVAQADARPVMPISFRQDPAWPSPRQTPGPQCLYSSDRPASSRRRGRRQARHAHILLTTRQNPTGSSEISRATCPSRRRWRTRTMQVTCRRPVPRPDVVYNGTNITDCGRLIM